MRADLSRPVRAFHVETFGAGKTGPLDHYSRLVCTRAEFRAALRHVRLAPDQHKASVGAWVPVDAKTRDEGGTTANRKGVEYLSASQVGRHLENVTGSSASTMLDIDKIPADRWVTLLEHIRELGWSGESWSTASYDPASGLVSARLHLHLDRELSSAEEVERVRRAIAWRLSPDVCDRACFQPVAIFYLPASRGASFVELFDGGEIVVDALPMAPAPRARAREPRALKASYTITAADKELAREELSRHATRIVHHPDEHIRELCAKGKTYYLGQYIEAGVLDEVEARETLGSAVAAWADRIWPGEDNSAEVERRIVQIVDEAIADGRGRGAALPAERVSPRDRLLSDIDSGGEVIERRTADEIVAEARKLVGTGAILALPPGTGKTRAALEEIASSRQDAIVYAPSHALAEEHRQALLALGVPAADIAHEMSPLHRPAGGEESCERSRVSRGDSTEDGPSPFAQTIRSARINLRATVCPSCPMRETCPVRFAQPSKARVRLKVHSAYDPVEPGKAKVFLDEEPEPFERIEVSPKQLDLLCAPRVPVLEALTGAAHAYWTSEQVEAERAKQLEAAALADETPTGFDPGQAYYVRRAALSLRAGRGIPEDILAGLVRSAGTVRLSAAVARALAEAPEKGLPVPEDGLEAVRAILGLAYSRVGATRRPDGVMEAVSETPTRRDTRRGYVQLLSATPTPGAYDGIPTYAPEASDGCGGLVREVLYLARSSTTDWRANARGALAATRRLLEACPAARRYLDPSETSAGVLGAVPLERPRVLLVTFKHVVAKHSEALRALLPGADVELRWFGAVAGSNLYEQGAELEVEAIVTLGDYYANRRWLFDHLAAEKGMTDPDELDEYVESAGREQIAQELAQAHGRARDPRRTRPLVHLHLGRTMPHSWRGRCQARFLRGE